MQHVLDVLVVFLLLQQQLTVPHVPLFPVL